MDPKFIDDTAQVILAIIRSGGPITWSWGTRAFNAMVYRDMAALQFVVSGFIHSGKVIVAYNGGTDTFEVYCLVNDVVVKSRNDIYFDQLVDVIDGMVEKNCSESDYHDKVNKWLTDKLI